MARCAFSPKKTEKLKTRTGLPIVHALTRGGTEHRIDLCLEDGSVMHLYTDGTLEKSDIGWKR